MDVSWTAVISTFQSRLTQRDLSDQAGIEPVSPGIWPNFIAFSLFQSSMGQIEQIQMITGHHAPKARLNQGLATIDGIATRKSVDCSCWSAELSNTSTMNWKGL